MSKDFFQRRHSDQKGSSHNLKGADQRYYDRRQEIDVVKLLSGDYYITNQPNQMIQTVLGSCVAACLRDPVAKVAGMNHFLLPSSMSGAGDDRGQGARFGAFAMEQLINGMMKLGAKRERIEVKVFGGSDMTQTSTLIGTKNVLFIREFLKNEELKIVSEDLGGNYPRRVHFFTDTGKVMLRCLRRKEDMQVVDEEKQYAKKITTTSKDSGDVELFD